MVINTINKVIPQAYSSLKNIFIVARKITEINCYDFVKIKIDTNVDLEV